MNKYSLKGYLGEKLSGSESTLKETSFDKENNKHLCTDTTLQNVYDFDAFIDQLFSEKHKKPASPDAIHIGRKKLYFIEFKNQRRSNVETKEIKNKFKRGTQVLDEILGQFKPKDNKFVFCVVYKNEQARYKYQRHVQNKDIHFGLEELNVELGGFYDKIITQSVDSYKTQFHLLNC